MKLSFCLTTYNKKEFLEITLAHFLANRDPEYQLIVADGFSTDGTADYLLDLERQGLIDQLILPGERDHGEWHGFKRTLDHVIGDYFYILTDDDYFDFEIIARIAHFLEQNQHIDYLVADGLDLKTNGQMELTRYHDRMRYIAAELPKGANRNHMCDVFLSEGACGLGLFVNARLISQLELFSPKFGKRTDKGITSTLFNSRFIGASTDLRTYVSIKNEKSNSVIYNYDYRHMETLQSTLDDPDKRFLADHDLFWTKFNSAQRLLDTCPSQPRGEFSIYQPFGKTA